MIKKITLKYSPINMYLLVALFMYDTRYCKNCNSLNSPDIVTNEKITIFISQ